MANLPSSVTREAAYDYWRVSKAFHGRGEQISVQDAFAILNEYLDWMGSHRLVVRRMLTIRSGIIQGKRRRRKAS